MFWPPQARCCQPFLCIKLPASFVQAQPVSISMCHCLCSLLGLDAGPAGVIDEVHASPDIVIKPEEEGNDERRFGEPVCHRLVHQPLQCKYSLQHMSS